MRKKRWTKDEVEFLEAHYSTRGATWVAKQIGRTFQSVCKKAYYLRVQKSKPQTLIGKRFGKWTVIGTSNKRPPSGNIYWNCRCDCGTVTDIQKPSLINAKSMQCVECAQKIKYFGNIPCSYITRLKWRVQRRKLNLKTTIEELDILYKKQNGVCALSGIQIGFFDAGDLSKSKSLRGHTASLDRIDNSKGYTLNNIQWVHRDINIMKNLLDQNLFVHLCHRVAQHSFDELGEKSLDLPGWMQV